MKYIVLLLSLYVFVGCGGASYSVPLQKDIKEVASDSNAAYITFTRPVQVGYAISTSVIEFFPETKTSQFIGVISAGKRMIYKVSPGKHFFYLYGGENHDTSVVEVTQGKMYFMEIEPSMGVTVARFYFKPSTLVKRTLEEKLLTSKCDKNFLSQNNFKEKKQRSSSSFGGSKKYYSYQLKTTIKCNRDEVTDVSGITSIKELNDTVLSKPTPAAYQYYEKVITPTYLEKVSQRFIDLDEEDIQETEIKPEDGIAL